MRTFAFIFARGGSKGVHGKNIRKLAGKPLLSYSIVQANEVVSVDKVFVSTDDSNIAAIAREYGANVIDRPQKLALDNSPEWLAWQHGVNWVREQGDKFDVFLSLPTTSPMRNKYDIQKVLEKLDSQTDVVLTMTPASRSPWFNMVTINRDGYASLVKQNKKKIQRRQDAPAAYDLTTVAYATRPQFILSHGSVFDGRVRAVEIPRERAFDIDTELDWDVVEYMIKKSAGIHD
jgi:N,N'-diacetyl-8-epilegionaminate cytidylyltransferase